ncbi:hypothetical protein SAMN02949497_0540 [Methylomagnum ishizawai]|uniref:Uncharacterized protein n=1 Tax=Methylomagnum ishizawai TaxID=1760988 RepID=A0A1Y6DB08_9GAMM|nr:hypothetical protein [Methylomagnum ishizawai]SMF97324.1 hypothetical protein SAMN02949497_0344 [Methylomagnum ishizawai]SMF97510.1 hypothetical protein SAMN02949497_0540 [Methylomagnum ishizawai]
MTTQTSEQTLNAEDTAPGMIILDVGTQNAKRIKKLCKGKGKLLRKVDEAVDQLRDAGKVKRDAQVVLVVVRKEVGLFDSDDDDDDDD